MTQSTQESIVERRSAARLAQRPEPEARGLPNHCYIDETYYREEQQRLLQRTWVCAGPASQLPDPGSVRTMEVSGVPIILSRDRKGTVRAFQNVCPHRGVQLVTEDRDNAAMMTCPYHGWTFGLDGGLKARPHFFGPGGHANARDEALHACDGLIPVRLEYWNDVLLVNIDGKAPPLAQHTEVLDREAGNYDLSHMRYGGMVSNTFQANWKLAVENWLDSYHVFMIHPELDKVMVPEMRKAAIGDGNIVFSDFPITETGMGMHDDLPRIPGMPEEIRNMCFFPLQFPNWSLSLHPSYMILWHFVPLAVDQTRVDVHIYFVGDAAVDARYAERRKELFDYYHRLNGEDEAICMRMQKGRRAPGYDGGRFSPYWDAGTVHLANLVRQAMA